MAEELRAKVGRKSAISLQRGQFDPKFQVEGVAPPIIFARIVRPMNALQLCRWLFSHKETFFKQSAILDGKHRPMGTPPSRAKNARGVAKCSDFGLVEGYISETVQDGEVS